MISTFPQWNKEGVIPPIDPQNPTSRQRSPYKASLAQFTEYFAKSPARIEILRGFLDYRAALHAIGAADGFQWLNGSFLENKEALRGQDPGDIDVVTFFYLPPNTPEPDFVNRDFSLFDPNQHAQNKARFRVDAFFQPLYAAPERLVEGSNYWSGMWSHQRDTFRWKGFLQVPLSSFEDATATTFLAMLPRGAAP